MPGLSESELPPEALHAGDLIEYYSRAFVFGDRRGYRRAVVTRVDDDDDVDFTVTVSTEEVIPKDLMLKRLADHVGTTLEPSQSKWRKLRTFTLAPGAFSAPTSASVLNSALQAAVAAAYDAVREESIEEREEIVPETPQSSVCSSPETQTNFAPAEAPSTPARADTPELLSSDESTVSKESPLSEKVTWSSSLREIIDLVSPREASGASSEAEAAAYVRSVPNRHTRPKIRHQPKKRRAQWHVLRSRKRRHLAKCAVTRSGSELYHARTLKACKFHALASSPEVREGLDSLHTKRSKFEDPESKHGRTLCKTVECPAVIAKITTCKHNGARFEDIGSVDPCACYGDCFWDSCRNVASESFCTPKNCSLGAFYSNAPRTLSTLKLFDTGRLGLGVYTTTPLDVGDVLGEYCGELSEFAAAVEGQPPQAVKMNTGYTLLYNAKSINGNNVYVDALKCGSITRFVSHSCDPNAAFVEQQTRRRVRVLVKMVRNVQAGAQITVHYGNQRWFRCACDRCWKDGRQHESSEDE